MFIAWTLIAGGLACLMWYVKRTREGQRVLAEIEAYGKPDEYSRMPNVTLPAGLFLVLVFIAVLIELWFSWTPEL